MSCASVLAGLTPPLRVPKHEGVLVFSTEGGAVVQAACRQMTPRHKECELSVTLPDTSLAWQQRVAIQATQHLGQADQLG